MRFPEYFTDSCWKEESEDVIEQKIEALLCEMTTEEKAELCHGGINPPVPGQVGNGGYLKGVPRLGAPEIRMYDGPAGVTSIYETTGLPAEELLASTFSRRLAYEFGKVTGSENKMISGNCQLGAEADLVRTTHFNRTRDMLGEDPYLAGELLVPLVKGIQDNHVMAILKHFAGYVVSANPANSPDTVIDEQTMHELYLAPFEKAIQEGNAAGVMTAYNRVNGPYAAASEYLLKEVLREEWAYKGLTMCDWGGNHSFSLSKGMDIEMPMGAYNSTERILRFLENGKLSEEDLNQAVRHVLNGLAKAGYLSLVTLDESGRVLTEADRIEPIRMPDTYREKEAVRKENAAIAEEITVKGAVLLKNENQALPLCPKDYKEEESIAVVGIGGLYPVCGYGQERSYGTLEYMKAPVMELQQATGRKDAFVMQPGIDLVGRVIPSDALYTEEDGEEHGLKRCYGITKEDGYRPPLMSMGGAGEEFTGVASRDAEEDDEDLDFKPMDLFMPGSDAADMDGYETGSICCVDKTLEFTCGCQNKTYRNDAAGNAFIQGEAYTWKGCLLAPEDGEYQLNLQAIGGIAVFKMDVDGTGYRDIGLIKMREGTQWPWGNLVCTPEGMEVCCTRITLEKGKRYPIVVYGKALLKEKDLQLRLAWVTPSQAAKQRKDAIEAAEKAKKTLYFVHSGFKTAYGQTSGALSFQEGTDLELDKEQKELLFDLSEAVHKNGGQLIVLAYHGSAFAMKSWIDKTDALMYMWMPGQSGSTALRKLLLGEAVPGGKIAQSFPNTNEDTLITDSLEHKKERWDGEEIPGKPLRVTASEGIYSGYRWYDKEGREPLFEFGFGLSYTTFAYSDLQIINQNNKIRVQFMVENTGEYAGDEIVQVYLGAGEAPPYVMMPQKQLCGFERLEGMQPKEKRMVSIEVPERSLMYWDIHKEKIQRENGTKDKWQKATGIRKILVGASSLDIRLKGTVTIL